MASDPIEERDVEKLLKLLDEPKIKQKIISIIEQKLTSLQPYSGQKEEDKNNANS